jgi:hypothetical protein
MKRDFYMVIGKITKSSKSEVIVTIMIMTRNIHFSICHMAWGVRGTVQQTEHTQYKNIYPDR